MADSPTFIGTIATILSAVAALQALIYLLNGVVIQSTELKKRIEILIEKEGQKTKLTVDASDAQSLNALIQALNEKQGTPTEQVR